MEKPKLYKYSSAEHIFMKEKLLERIDMLEEEMQELKGGDPIINTEEKKRWMSIFNYYWKLYISYQDADPKNHNLTFNSWMGYQLIK